MIINMSYGDTLLANRLLVCPIYVASVFCMDSLEQLSVYRDFYWKLSPKEWLALCD